MTSCHFRVIVWRNEKFFVSLQRAVECRYPPEQQGSPSGIIEGEKKRGTVIGETLRLDGRLAA